MLLVNFFVLTSAYVAVFFIALAVDRFWKPLGLFTITTRPCGGIRGWWHSQGCYVAEPKEMIELRSGKLLATFPI